MITIYNDDALVMHGEKCLNMYANTSTGPPMISTGLSSPLIPEVDSKISMKVSVFMKNYKFFIRITRKQAGR